MASKYFTGGGFSAIAQIDTLTVGGTVEADDIFNVILTDENGTAVTLAVSAGSTTISVVCTNIAAAFNASTDARFTPVTAAAGATTVTLTADTASVPFSCTVTTTELGGGAADAQTFVRAATTANKGSGDWGTAANWSDLIVPVNTDSVVLDGRMATAITYGLNQSAVTLASLKHYRGAKAVGTTTAALRISVTAGDSNLPTEDGSNPAAAFFNVNVGTAQTTWSNWGSASIGSSGLEPVVFDGTHASNVLHVYGGTVGVGTMTPGDTSVVATLNVIGNGAKAVVSSGTTLTTANFEDAGKGVIRCAATTVNVTHQSCEVRTEGSGTIGTLNAGGAVYPYGTGTVTTLNVGTGGVWDTTKTNVARTVTNQVNLYGGGRVKSDLNTTYSAGIGVYQGANTSQVEFPQGVKVTPAAAA